MMLESQLLDENLLRLWRTGAGRMCYLAEEDDDQDVSKINSYKVCYYSNKAYFIHDKQSLHKQTIQLVTPRPLTLPSQLTRVRKEIIIT